MNLKSAYQNYAGGVSQPKPPAPLPKSIIPRNVVQLSAPEEKKAKLPLGTRKLPVNQDRPFDKPFFKNFAQPWNTVSGTGFGRAYWTNDQNPYTSM